MSTQNEVDEKLCKIITFNGQGLSGKSTQSRLLVKSNEEKYRRIYSYKLREDFENKVYESLNRKNTCIKYLNPDVPDQTLHMVEVLGIPTLAWLTAYFHKEVKQLQENYTIVLDHYIADFYVNMLKGYEAEKFQSFVKNHLGIPHFKQGIHFYLDIDYETYKDRWKRTKETNLRDLKVNEKDFEERRGRHKELCGKGYLEYIDATDMSGLSPEKSVNKVAEEIKSVLDKRLEGS